MSEFKSVFKSTIAFGGNQFFSILTQIAKTKAIALFLGPNGVGVLSLINSSLALITSATDMGLRNSTIKEISSSSEIPVVANVAKKTAFFTGVFGTLLMFFMSNTVSKICFNNQDWSYTFRWLSIFVLFSHLTNVNMGIIQGMRNLSIFSRVNIYISVLGSLIPVVAYYIMGIKGLIIATLGAAISSYIVSAYFVKFKTSKLTSLATIKSYVKRLVALGFFISMAGFMSNGVGYLLRLMVSNGSDITSLGLYTASYALVHSYLGLVLNTLAMDYFPRLSSVFDRNKELVEIAVAQLQVALLVILPLVLTLILFRDYIIRILYSDDFAGMGGLLEIFALGMILKTSAWGLSYIVLAKGRGSRFLIIESLANIQMLIFSFIGFHLFGLLGLGYGFIVAYLIYFAELVLYLRIFEEFKLKKTYIVWSLLIFTIAVIFVFLKDFQYVNVSFYIISLSLALYVLLSRLSLRDLIKKKIW